MDCGGLDNKAEIRKELDKILEAPVGHGLESVDADDWGTSPEAQDEMMAFMAMGAEA